MVPVSTTPDAGSRVATATPASGKLLPQRPQAAAASTKSHGEDSPLTETVRAAAKRLEAFLQSSGRSVQFAVDADSGMTVITVRVAATGEVIRQIPSEEVLRL